MVERKREEEPEVDARNKEKTPSGNKANVGRTGNYESFRVVLLSLLTPRSSSSRRALWVLRRVPIDMASLERGEETSLPWEEQGRES